MSALDMAFQTHWKQMEVETDSPLSSQLTEVVILVKAAPQVGQKHGETVCCAGVDAYGNWLRLYPVAFRTLEKSQKFKRWDLIRFKSRKPKDDPRPESRRIVQESLEICGELKKRHRYNFLNKSIVTSLRAEREAGRSLALLKARNYRFTAERKTAKKIAEEEAEFEELRRQGDLFSNTDVIPYHPCPFLFKYRYETDDGSREGTCQDWEMEATYFKWSNMYGERKALAEMSRIFGEEYPERGMFLAMGTHSLYPDTWLINGIVRLDEQAQGSLL